MNDEIFNVDVIIVFSRINVKHFINQNTYIILLYLYRVSFYIATFNMLVWYSIVNIIRY